METKMKNLIKHSFVMILAAVLFTACSTEENPVDPIDPGNGGGDPTINTPKYLKISSIILTSFPLTKPNGAKWDYHVFSNSPTRRPDIYVELSKSGSSSHVFRSETIEDAQFENAYDRFVFTTPASSNGGSLPHDIPMNQTFDIDVMDNDGLSADDWMGSVTINPSGYYNNDNATFLFKTLVSGETRIELEGRWIY
jgi:hypothetical protein